MKWPAKAPHRAICDPLLEKPKTTRLCDNCQGITAEALASAYGHIHVDKVWDLWQSIGQCDLCAALWQSLPQGIRSSIWTDRSRSRRSSTYMGSYENMRLKVQFPPSPDAHGRRACELTAIYDGPKGWECLVLKGLSVFTRPSDPAERVGFPPVNGLLQNTQSEETFEFLRSCLQDCSSHYFCSRQSFHDYGSTATQKAGSVVGRPSVWPSRLIEVRAGHYRSAASPSEKDCVRLVDLHDHCPEYMTLSHCWGKRGLKRKDKTLRRSLRHRQQSIAVKTLCANFQHAIEITRRLGINYLWIDALCIIQDSASDWDAESVKMGDIYQNSYLTISANVAGDSSGGCFNHKSTTHDSHGDYTECYRKIEVPHNDSNGRDSTLIFLWDVLATQRLLTWPADEPEHLHDGPSLSRGWIFQERLLSPRTAHFTRNQVVWECRQMYRFEDLFPLHPSLRPRAGFLLQDGDPSDEGKDWRDMLSLDYTLRLFTNPQDRLVAIAGIARMWESIFNDAYVAGLWRSHLALGLAWAIDPTFPAPSKGRFRAPRARYPTWTWSSADRRIQWPVDSETQGISKTVFRAEPRFMLKAENLLYRNKKARNLYNVDGGSIYLEAPVTDLEFVMHKYNGLKVRTRVKGFTVYLHMDIRYRALVSQLPKTFPVLVLGRMAVSAFESTSAYLLLLRARSASPKAYERIGLAEVTFTNVMDYGEFCYDIPTREIHLY